MWRTFWVVLMGQHYPLSPSGMLPFHMFFFFSVNVMYVPSRHTLVAPKEQAPAVLTKDHWFFSSAHCWLRHLRDKSISTQSLAGHTGGSFGLLEAGLAW